ncbi:hypothetical protein BU17DRAFT_100024 [Hysterangium stoloniferum]|nr:hypothetical protein BU17DRAFT_100024 [Hysterangium stoloniferum]
MSPETISSINQVGANICWANLMVLNAIRIVLGHHKAGYSGEKLLKRTFKSIKRFVCILNPSKTLLNKPLTIILKDLEAAFPHALSIDYGSALQNIPKLGLQYRLLTLQMFQESLSLRFMRTHLKSTMSEGLDNFLRVLMDPTNHLVAGGIESITYTWAFFYDAGNFVVYECKPLVLDLPDQLGTSSISFFHWESIPEYLSSRLDVDNPDIEPLFTCYAYRLKNGYELDIPPSTKAHQGNVEK